MNNTLTLKNTVCLGRLPDFSVEQIFDCGQCFRFNKTEDGAYEGIAFSHYLKLFEKDSMIYALSDIDGFDIGGIWYVFLDLGRDYGAIKASVCRDGALLERAADYGGGIRILRQDRWEALCSFIISQNNNIPRIKKIIDRLCKNYGKSFEAFGNTYYSFPTPEALLSAGEEKIFECGTGFRAKYIMSAAKTVFEDKAFFDCVDKLPSEAASAELEKIKGVGPKVAACALLFGFAKFDCMPVDVWMKKIFDKYFGGKVPDFGEYAGLVQQYLFYYERSITLNEEK